MIPWKIYGTITHDPSSHVNLPLGLPEQCDISMRQEEAAEEEDTPNIDTWHNMRVRVDLYNSLH
jgi:hypothetical protein